VKQEWKDATNYSRGQERIPTAWEIGAGGVRVYVTKAHRMCPGSWVMHCHAVGIDTLELMPDTAPVDDAKEAALTTALDKAQAISRAILAMGSWQNQQPATDTPQGG
jgi:hypothetical protein